jgi:hypothetical protein
LPLQFPQSDPCSNKAGDDQWVATIISEISVLAMCRSNPLANPKTTRYNDGVCSFL